MHDEQINVEKLRPLLRLPSPPPKLNWSLLSFVVVAAAAVVVVVVVEILTIETVTEGALFWDYTRMRREERRSKMLSFG